MDRDLDTNGVPGIDEDELRPRIGRPSPVSTMPPIIARGLGMPAAGSTEDLETKAATRFALTREPSPLEARTAADQAELGRLQATGSGISQIKNPIARGALRGLNIAGEIGGALFPQINTALRAIPGTEEHHQRLIGRQQGRIGEDEAEAQKEATTEETQARTEQATATAEKDRAATAAAGQPKPKEESWKVVPGVVGPGGKVLQEEQNSGQLRWGTGIEGVESLKEPTAKGPHVTYDAGIPVSVDDGQGHTYDVNDPKLPAELKPLVEAASRAHGQHVQEDADKQARAAAQQEKMFEAHQEALTSQTKSMIESAPKVLALAQRIDPLIDKLKDDLGPAAGRWSEFWAGKVGASKPEYTKLRTDIGLLSTALMRMHVGARGGELMMQHFKDLIDQGKQSPENLKAALEEIVQYAHDVQSERPGAAGGKSGNAKGNDPLGIR